MLTVYDIDHALSEKLFPVGLYAPIALFFNIVNMESPVFYN